MSSFYHPDRTIASIARVVLESNPEIGCSRKKKRAWHRLMSGFTRSYHRGERLRFLTLTSAVGSNPRLLSRQFQTLRKRIEHQFRFSVQYWKINTSEGNGVIHLVYKAVPLKGHVFTPKMGFLPSFWLSAAWFSITGLSKILKIKSLSNKPGRLANYLVSQYLTGQSYERMSWSWGWVFRGFCHTWSSRFSAWYKSDKAACLAAWDKLISGYSPPGVVLHAPLV